MARIELKKSSPADPQIEHACWKSGSLYSVESSPSLAITIMVALVIDRPPLPLLDHQNTAYNCGMDSIHPLALRAPLHSSSTKIPYTTVVWNLSACSPFELLHSSSTAPLVKHWYKSLSTLHVITFWAALSCYIFLFYSINYFTTWIFLDISLKCLPLCWLNVYTQSCRPPHLCLFPERCHFVLVTLFYQRWPAIHMRPVLKHWGNCQTWFCKRWLAIHMRLALKYWG